MSSQLDLIVNPGTGGRNDGPHLAEDLAGHLLSPGYLSSLGDQSGDTYNSSVITNSAINIQCLIRFELFLLSNPGGWAV